ncbi:hypothetical protein [Cryptosporangium japonicum]|uniref:Uncharacterized protein n=1 Tax=Cryptosporangium japonicum TaxID=80872 RepID=A0ABN0UDW2_9ACTN
MSGWWPRVAGGVAVLLALIGLFTGDVVAKNHERAATMYVGAFVLVVAGVVTFARPTRVAGRLVAALVVGYVIAVAATFALVRP